MSSELLPWIDIETTGLSAEADVMLEMGIVLTDKYGEEIDSWSTLIQDRSWFWQDRVAEVRQTPGGVDTPEDFVNRMHQKSGLWDDLMDESVPDLTTEAAEYAAIEFLSKNQIIPATAPMYGSSIGSLDRPFVLKHMPHLNEWFHYRNMDNTSLKILCDMHFPHLKEKRDEEYEARKMEHEKEHRVLADCRDSIAEYQFYLENMLGVAL